MKHHMTIVACATVFALMSTFTMGCGKDEAEGDRSSKSEPCKEEALAKLLSTGDRKAVIQSLSTVCTFPSELAPFVTIQKTWPPRKITAAKQKEVAEILEKGFTHVKGICSKILDVFATTGLAPPETRTAIFVQKCELERLGLASRKELLTAELIALTLNATLYHWLAERGVKQARAVGRLLLGL